MYFDENDYDTDNENNDCNRNEYTKEILQENEYDRKIEIINFYKELLMKEPEFIGIKNISSSKIYEIINENNNNNNNNDNNNNNNLKSNYVLNQDQYTIFNNMYNDLDIYGNNNIFNFITNKLFKIIYV